MSVEISTPEGTEVFDDLLLIQDGDLFDYELVALPDTVPAGLHHPVEERRT